MTRWHCHNDHWYPNFNMNVPNTMFQMAVAALTILITLTLLIRKFSTWIDTTSTVPPARLLEDGEARVHGQYFESTTLVVISAIMRLPIIQHMSHPQFPSLIPPVSQFPILPMPLPSSRLLNQRKQVLFSVHLMCLPIIWVF